ncbi:hypothetical protein P8C59_007309 [Phyllachora maydis]|uniref:DNA polymerase n=1 Tax=Phyllachora maydis TaxID=1825666 RepID=A0AAD9I845_9PEZI|nr:hypothetical protein P8C59_007309 [Phyllachora maydis]
MAKRKRDSSSKEMPAELSIFRGLSFFYIPNNDIAKPRGIRIRKAQAYGAKWVRVLDEASHIVVDGKLRYDDIKDMLASGPSILPIVVNEEWPADCISWRKLLNPGQKRREQVEQVGDADAASASQEQQLEAVVEADNAGPKDELSDLIDVVQRYRDVPVDEENHALSEDEESGGSSQDERPAKRQHTSSRKAQKVIADEDGWACKRGGTKDSHKDAQNPNARTMEILQKMGDYYESTGVAWKPRAYRGAIAALQRQQVKISTVEQAYALAGVGKRLAEKIAEIAQTDGLQRLEHTHDDPRDAVLQTFVQIYDVGISRAAKWIAQGFRTLDDLRDKADLTRNQRIGIDHYDDLNTRIPRAEVTALGEYVKREAAQIDAAVELVIGGSYRRGADSSGDIDFIVTKKGTAAVVDLVPFLERLVEVLEEKGFLVATLAALRNHRQGEDGPGSQWHGCCVLPSDADPSPGGSGAGNGQGDGSGTPKGKPIWRRIDFLLVPELEYGAALLYFTGNDVFNRSMRLLASKRGMRLNQRGLYKEVMRAPAREKIGGVEYLSKRSIRQ